MPKLVRPSTAAAAITAMDMDEPATALPLSPALPLGPPPLALRGVSLMWVLDALHASLAICSLPVVGPSCPCWPHLPEATMPVVPKRTACVHTHPLTLAPDPLSISMISCNASSVVFALATSQSRSATLKSQYAISVFCKET